MSNRTATCYASNGRAQFRITGTALEPLRIVRVDVEVWAGDRWEKASRESVACQTATAEIVSELTAPWNDPQGPHGEQTMQTTKPITEAMANGMLLVRDRSYRGASPVKSTWTRLEAEGYIVYEMNGCNGKPVLTEKGAAAIADRAPV